MFNKNLYNQAFHPFELSNTKILVTGGAGFIGSNLVEYLLRFDVGMVRVLDNLSNGYFENIRDFLHLPNFEFMEGDIRDLDTCKKAVHGMDYISHQAALGSVPRSIKDPIITNAVNISGFLNMLVVAKGSPTCKRFVYAASSSTYGDSPELPKVEGREGKPLSPYAVTKAVNEYYGDVFSKVYGFHAIGLRYFNVFGPKQNPNNPYAAVIPIFCKHFMEGTIPIINGDGLTSRDFTFVENAVQANVKAMFAVTYNAGGHDVEAQFHEAHEVFNVACGDQITLNDIIKALNEITGQGIKALYKEQRAGDVRHSKASIEKIGNALGYEPKIRFRDGLQLAYDWYLAQLGGEMNSHCL
jgi:UDP-N-acetylglucosamine 4-epimerase